MITATDKGKPFPCPYRSPISLFYFPIPISFDIALCADRVFSEDAVFLFWPDFMGSAAPMPPPALAGTRRPRTPAPSVRGDCVPAPAERALQGRYKKAPPM